MIRNIFFLIVIIWLAFLLIPFSLQSMPKETNLNLPQSRSEKTDLNSFAKCLAEKQITMYGTDLCLSCQNQKKAFGKSFLFVPYVHCPSNPLLCSTKGVKTYPTWIFPDGKKLIGAQSLKNLSRESGCPLP
jgi:hypothetical protein